MQTAEKYKIKVQATNLAKQQTVKCLIITVGREEILKH